LIDSSSPSLSPVTHEPIIGKKMITNSSYIVQTTSFPDSTDGTIDKKIRRWNNISTDRSETINPLNKSRKYPLTSTSSTGFQVMNLPNQQQQQQKSITFSPIVEQEQGNEREESPLPLATTPLVKHLPPRKPPRTFENEHKYTRVTKTNDQKVPSSSSSNSNSPTFDPGMKTFS